VIKVAVEPERNFRTGSTKGSLETDWNAGLKALLATAGKKLSISVVGVRKEFATIVHCGNVNSILRLSTSV